MTQQQISEIFNVQKAAISKHAKNIFDTGELDKKSTVSILETVQLEGKRKIARKIESDPKDKDVMMKSWIKRLRRFKCRLVGKRE